MTALEQYTSICAEAGTRFVGLFTPDDERILVMWTSLITGSTYCLDAEKISPAEVDRHTREHDEKFFGKVW